MIGLSLWLRIWISRHFGRVFPGLYSTLDNPVEIPVQIAAYRLVTEKYIQEGDSILDVGFGLGYGLKIMAEKASRLSGIDIDQKAVKQANKMIFNSKIKELIHYDGYLIPFAEHSFDVVTCIDVIEHVPDYMRLIRNLCKVARRNVIISTPNRRPEHMNANGSPKNPWHIREWSYEEFDQILKRLGERYKWNFLNGPWAGPFSVSDSVNDDTMALTPVISMGNYFT